MDNHLTDREIKILEMVRDGVTTQAIANKMEISVQTIKNHISNIFPKLGAVDRTTAVVIAIRRGIITLE